MSAITPARSLAETAPVSASQRRWNAVSREFEWCARLVVGGIFLWSAAAHLANPYYFLSTVYQYELTSAPVGAIVASVLPFLELLLAACLLGGACPQATWFLTSLLLLLFVGAQTSALVRDLRISCGCFGPEISQPVDMMSVGFTSALAVLAISGALAARVRPPVDAPPTA
ncbi:MAG: MauE/DoxX family redox-associated membrane protein [Planctomycetota bacterium]